MNARLRFLLSPLSLALTCCHLTAQVVNFHFMEDYNSTNLNFGPGATGDEDNY